MNQISHTDRVRQFIQDLLVHHGASVDMPPRETLLIKGGNYCGHRICLGPFYAVWFVEEDQIKFFGPQGLLETRSPSRDLPVMSQLAAA